MYTNTRKRNPRTSAFIFDIFHIMIGILIVGMAILCFLNPIEYEFLFVLIFLLAAILNIANSIVRLKENQRKKKQKISGVLLFIFGILLLVLSFISFICLFGR